MPPWKQPPHPHDEFDLIIMVKSALNQITASYSVEEDRIMLRISTSDQTEFRLWLTRRFIHVLWQALLTIVSNDDSINSDLTPKIKDAVVAMSHQEAVDDTDFSRNHAENNVDRTSNTGPLLVTGGTLTPASKEITALSLKTKNGETISFDLNHKLLHALCHLLIETTNNADWKLDLTVGDPMVIKADKTHLH